jgi:drug/metabolite transporter (DMT)-like permease
VSASWIYLGLCVVAYGFANYLQAVAVSRVSVHTSLDPGLLLRLARQRTYLLGVLCQFVGFVFAFLARADLPLFLVQTTAAAGLGVTALLGVFLLRWRLPRAEIALLGTLALGLAGLIVSAQRSPSRELHTGETLALGSGVLLIALLGVVAVRVHGARGSVVLGCLAGLCFGAAAVASRPLASVHSLPLFLGDPLLYILVLYVAVGQLMLGLAMQRGSTTAAVAAMDATAVVPAALIGLLLLGDRIEPGLGWLAAAGFVVTLGSILGLTRYAAPQHGCAPPREPTADPATVAEERRAS